MTHNNDWLMVEIATGLQKLALLSLDRTPAAELIAGTARAWLEAITADSAFDCQRDTPRIRAAFRALAKQRDSWPAPRHFIEALPRVEQRALGYEIKPASREEADAAMARIREILGEPMPTFEAERPKREGASRAEVEEALRQHYDGRAAAAGPDA